MIDMLVDGGDHGGHPTIFIRFLADHQVQLVDVQWMDVSRSTLWSSITAIDENWKIMSHDSWIINSITISWSISWMFPESEPPPLSFQDTVCLYIYISYTYIRNGLYSVYSHVHTIYILYILHDIYIYIFVYGRLYFTALYIGKSKYVSLWLDIGLAVHSVVKVIRPPNTLGLMAGEEHT